MIVKYIGDFNIDFSVPVFQSGILNKVVFPFRGFPSYVRQHSYCSWAGNRKTWGSSWEEGGRKDDRSCYTASGEQVQLL